MTEFVNTLGISLKDIGRAIGLEVTVRDGVLLTNALPTVAQLQQGLYASREHDALCCCNMGRQQELWRQGLSDSWQQGMGGSLPSYRQQEMWRKSLSINSSFCKALVSTGYLTWQQMLDAVCRYRLGADRKGRVIFWQIDRDERICDGKVMAYGPDCHRLKEKEHAPTWVSALLAKRHGGKQEGDIVRHCLFGLHLLKDRDLQPVAVVEAEKTAVILSAYYLQYVWLATGGLFEVQPEKFRPLKGRKVILFPDTDPDGKAYAYWYEAAQLVMAQPYWENSPPIRVSALLEQHATDEQKRRKIDLVEFITESKENYHYHGKF